MAKSQAEKKPLKLIALIALVVGNMMGSGVFLLPASLASYGTISILAWTFTCIGAIFLALVFARLSRILPKTGGPYAYCHAAYGDFVGFQVAYNYWIAVWIGNAAIVVAMVGYLAVFWPALDRIHWLALVVSVGAVWLVTFINILGVREAGQVQIITTILKFVPLALIAVIGLFFIHPHNLAAFNVSGKSNMSAFTAAAAVTLWSFIGFESATVPAGSAVNPKRNIPIATVAGTVITAIVYILGTISVMGIIPLKQLAHTSSPYAAAAHAIFGAWGENLIGAAAVIACFGTLNGWVLLQGQIPMAAAQDNLFPKFFAKLSKNGTPVYGLIISSALITILLVLRYGASLVSQFTFMILLAVLASLIPYIYSTMVELVLVLRKRQPVSTKQLIKLSILPCLAFAYAFWMVAGAGRTIVYYGMLLFLSSLPVYIWLQSRKAMGRHV